MDLPTEVSGGFTRVCGDCGHIWATDVHPLNDSEPEACPECGHTNGEGEETYDWSICPGCGREGISKQTPPVETFPGQRYCSVTCAGMI